MTRETMYLTYSKLLASEFGITVPEPEEATQDRPRWSSTMDRFHGTRSLDN